MVDHEDSEDILNDSLAFLGGKPVIDDEVIRYGPLYLTLPRKEGKANTLLADHLFSPGLFLAERIERALLPVQGRTVIELGAGSALPSLLMSTLLDPPSLIVVTDYPDEGILGNLKRNVQRNHLLVKDGCVVECAGYDWGTDPTPILKLLPTGGRPAGFDLVILSDLLHFHSSHDALIASIKSLLAKSEDSRIHVAAGNYTQPHVCDNFLFKGKQAGLLFEENLSGPSEAEWKGVLEVSTLDKDALATRKAACRYWIGRWSDPIDV